jgi:hypothetical protein
LGRRRVAALLAASLLVAMAACSGDDDDSSSADDASSPADDEQPAEEAEQPEEEVEVVDPYDGHTSDVYDGTENWICHPDLDEDVCRDLSATEVSADGEMSSADMEVAEDPAIDCFYVYPTVSTDPGISSDLVANEAETSTVVAQAAPFAQTCRMFAPSYRQITLAGLGGSGFGNQEARDLAYGDVLDAWQTYISQYNDGRGVVLIGHSQGTGHLGALIADEIDGNEDLSSRLVSAILLGGTVNVPAGEDVGGDFQNLPACRESGQTGCIISFSTYPADQPPGDTAFFGRARGDGEEDLRALCVDPVELSGGEGVSDAIIPTQSALSSNAELAADIDTAYIKLPQILSAECVEDGDFDYFAVGGASDDDERTVAVEGLTTERLGPDWGLHLVDANVAMGNLLQVVATQVESFTSD